MAHDLTNSHTTKNVIAALDDHFHQIGVDPHSPDGSRQAADTIAKAAAEHSDLFAHSIHADHIPVAVIEMVNRAYSARVREHNRIAANNNDPFVGLT